MIRIQLNGQCKTLDTSVSVKDLLQLLNKELKKQSSVAVAINYDVIPQSQYESKKITDGDQVDILHPVAGG